MAQPRWRRSRLWLADFLRSDAAPTEALEFFATSDDWLLLQSVAANPNTPMELIERLAFSRDGRVAATAIRNPSMTFEFLWHTAEMAAVHGACPEIWRGLKERAEADLPECDYESQKFTDLWVLELDAWLELWKAGKRVAMPPQRLRASLSDPEPLPVGQRALES